MKVSRRNIGILPVEKGNCAILSNEGFVWALKLIGLFLIIKLPSRMILEILAKRNDISYI